MVKIPDFKKIIKPNWAHNVGFGISSETKKFVRQKSLHQSTISSDKNLLKKLGIKKKDKVLAIAGYYGDWAASIKKLGAKVDYSDISRPLVNFAKNNVKTKFGKYICSGYEFLPKKAREYDWTSTYEACGGSQGLPIAYLRSLLNNKGGVLITYTHKENPKSVGGKLRTYPAIVKTLAKVYNAKKKIKKLKIRARLRRDRMYENKLYLVCNILTNDSARKKAEMDVKVLEKLSNKSIIHLEKDAKKLNISKNELKQSLNRLNKLTVLVNKEFVKEIKIKK